MLHMTPYQSWTTLILLLVVAALLIYLLRSYEQRGARKHPDDSTAVATKAGSLAAVTPLRPAKRKKGRHLALVPDLPRMPSPKLYDWEIHGI